MSRKGEREYRDGLWSALQREGGPTAVSPSLIRQLGIHPAEHGVYQDADRTRTDPELGGPVTLALRNQTGRYDDALTSFGVTYHYPSTSRGKRDANEVDATKRAMDLMLPVFVVSKHEGDTRLRDVARGWVTHQSEATRTFYIKFANAWPGFLEQPPADRPFRLRRDESEPRKKDTQRSSRPGQEAFKRLVIERYGCVCAACGISVPEVIDAAHVFPFDEGGSDDPRNGVPLCSTHHRAFDRFLLQIDPSTLRLFSRSRGPSLHELLVTASSIDAFICDVPHPAALEARSDMAAKRGAAT